MVKVTFYINMLKWRFLMKQTVYRHQTSDIVSACWVPQSLRIDLTSFIYGHHGVLCKNDKYVFLLWANRKIDIKLHLWNHCLTFFKVWNRLILIQWPFVKKCLKWFLSWPKMRIIIKFHIKNQHFKVENRFYLDLHANKAHVHQVSVTGPNGPLVK